MLQAPLNLGCGACNMGCDRGMGCPGCGGKCGIGDAEANYEPSTEVEKLLWDYIQEKEASGDYWYISPALNATTYNMDMSIDGMGFFPAIFATIASVGAKVGAVVAKVAPIAAKAANTAGTLATLPGVSATANSNAVVASSQETADLAAKITAQVQSQLATQDITLPKEIATPVVQASMWDMFGGDKSKPYVIAGALGLLALLLLR